MEKERKVLTVNEVADKLGICSQLVRRQIKKGVIPCVKVGDRYLIPIVAFERWLAECNEAASGEIDGKAG
ncbi:helix-turn-helix domain-containing protein [Chloroflexota bacterium]